MSEFWPGLRIGTTLEVWVRSMGCEGHRLTMTDMTGKRVRTENGRKGKCSLEG